MYGKLYRTTVLVAENQTRKSLSNQSCQLGSWAIVCIMCIGGQTGWCHLSFSWGDSELKFFRSSSFCPIWR